MAEGGEQILVGMGKPVAEKPKGVFSKAKEKFQKAQKPFVDAGAKMGERLHVSGTVDKVRERVKDRLSQNTGLIVEKKWMDAYQKTVDATDPGLRKKALERARPLAWAVAKANRIVSAVVDVGLGVYGVLSVGGGAVDIIKPQKTIDISHQMLSAVGDLYQTGDKMRDARIDLAATASRKTKSETRLGGAKNVGIGLVDAMLAKARISHVASGWMADIVGKGGEKIVQIQNKILRRKPKPEVSPA